MNKIQPKLLTIAFIIFAFARVAPAQTTAFTYQGRLSDASAQANGTFDLGFALFDAASGGTQIGVAQTRAAVNVLNGVFTVQLDFGAAAFPGANRYLEIAVKRLSNQNFTTLAPRQPVTSTPYAIQSLNAAATNSQQLGGVAAASYLQTAGNGANLTNLNAANITTGTLSDTALSANVTRRNAANTFTGNQTIAGDLSQTGAISDLNVSSGFVARGTLNTGAGAWNSISDRNMKENFQAVNARDVLQKVLKLPISTWNYKSQDASIRHIGAIEQDFKAAFKVGESDKMIATIDSDGVAFAAIQGLNEELNERANKLEAQNERLEKQQQQQQAKIDAMKKLLCAGNPTADVCQPEDK